MGQLSQIQGHDGPAASAASPGQPLVVAAIQATPVPAEIAANAKSAARLVDQAAAAGAQLAVLPELFLCGYHPPTLRAADPASTHLAAGPDRVIDDPRLEQLAAAARDRGLVVLVGAAVRHVDGRRTCSALVIDGNGHVTAEYDKQILWGPDERDLFVPGDRHAGISVDGWRLGLGICYDGCFPELARASALAGAHAYLCPSGYLTGSQHRRDIYYAARALDNTMYVVFANSVGAIGSPPWVFNGGAAVYDPQGQPLRRAGNDAEAVVVATMDPVELARVRERHTMLRDLPSPPDSAPTPSSI